MNRSLQHRAAWNRFGVLDFEYESMRAEPAAAMHTLVYHLAGALGFSHDEVLKRVGVAGISVPPALQNEANPMIPSTSALGATPRLVGLIEEVAARFHGPDSKPDLAALGVRFCDLDCRAHMSREHKPVCITRKNVLPGGRLTPPARRSPGRANVLKWAASGGPTKSA